ncbi:D-inositol-3-phosphate glycosyltransferase [Capillimicrobium parvum]|uniref:D-inositol-3-phosphate glycosyltransferase n=1 Tax=Capillimicrobium parvum TaxID=2884022 RepID=A0A9E7C1V8_9ACTN|nr:D-inositol-3-phosphate glycosyltransferase [Capillimicrobium parvum]
MRILRFGTRTWLCGAVYRAQFAAWKARLPGNDVLRTWGSGPLSPALRRAARTLPADVVAAASLPLNHLHYPVGRADGAPVVFLPAAHTGDRWGYERPNLVRVLNRGAATVPFTAHERDWLAEQGVRPERLHVIPAGIDTGAAGGRRGAFRAAHGIGTDDTIVAYVGQHGSHKGLDTLVAAVPALLAQRPDAWLVLAGARTPYSDRLAEQIAALDPAARARVVVRHDVPAQEKAALLADTDVFASPSHAESFGLTTLEAWDRRLPVVLGDSPSQREIAGAAAAFVAPGDAAALAQTLAALAADAQRRARLGEAGHALLQARFTRAAMVRAWAELLRGVAAGRARAAGAAA